MQIDLQGLRETTALAIQAGKETKAKQELLERQISEAKKAEGEAWAAAIMAEIPKKCYDAAMAGKNKVSVVRLRSWLDYESTGQSGIRQTLPPTKLKYRALVLWQNCVDAGLKPTLDYWWDGGGMEDGFDLTVHW